METALVVLIIILSVTLTAFLIVAIILAVLIIDLVKKLQKVTNEAERAVESVHAASDALLRASGPISLIQTMTKLFKDFRKSK